MPQWRDTARELTQLQPLHAVQQWHGEVPPRHVCSSLCRCRSARLEWSAGRLNVATNWDGNAHLDEKAYQPVASNGKVDLCDIRKLNALLKLRSRWTNSQLCTATKRRDTREWCNFNTPPHSVKWTLSSELQTRTSSWFLLFKCTYI